MKIKSAKWAIQNLIKLGEKGKLLKHENINKSIM